MSTSGGVNLSDAKWQLESSPTHLRECITAVQRDKSKKHRGMTALTPFLYMRKHAGNEATQHAKKSRVSRPTSSAENEGLEAGVRGWWKMGVKTRKRK